MDRETQRAVPTTPELKRVLKFLEDLRSRNVLVTSLKFAGLELELADLALIQSVDSESGEALEGKPVPDNWREAVNQYRKELNG